MTRYRSIQKLRNKSGRIIGYKLKDINGKTIDISSVRLKYEIMHGTIEVINLALTINNKLIDKVACETLKVNQSNRSKEISNKVISTINRARALGINIIKLKNDGCYAIYREGNLVVLITDEATKCNRGFVEDHEEVGVDEVRQVTVIGGGNLGDTSYMFNGCEAQSIDLSNFDTTNVVNMSAMFAACAAKNIDLSGMDTYKVRDMRNMFYKCNANKLNLSNFNTGNVKYIDGIFECCKSVIVTSDKRLKAELNKGRT